MSIASLRPALRWLPLVALGSLLACGDDADPVRPPRFAVVLIVHDAQGQPVPGLELGLAPDTPAYGERPSLTRAAPTSSLHPPYPSPFYPSAEIAFSLDQQAQVEVTIEDVEGTPIRTVSAGVQPAGEHTVYWNGRDGADAPVASGVYRARLRVVELLTDVVLADLRQPMLRAAFYAHQYRVGTTDDRGRIVIDDRRLFPFLYGIDDFDSTDEIGQITGTIHLVPTMRFYLSDPGTDAVQRFDRDVTGPTSLFLVWDPPVGAAPARW